ncbi:MAG: hypothetical protein JW951_00320, partial [Lentisphaerae bacterium]|nr:hypothetical protein [Lentisphaerota bacterium]
WRCGNRGNVASVLIEKPARGDFLPILDGGYSLQYSPLLEYREGSGLVLFCQMDVTGRTADDPAALRLARNLLEYASAWKARPRRRALYAGDPAGKRHLETAGFRPAVFAGGVPAAGDVLIVGKGGGGTLAPHAGALGAWLDAGGRVVALELDEREAGSFLPSPVRMRRGEHIAAHFEPFEVDSPLAGIGPADVHNRDPRELPLVRDGARAVGDGVLAVMDGGRVVFCQMAPYRFRTDAGNQRRTFRRASFLLTRLLANQGVESETPLLGRFASPVEEATGESVVRNGDFRKTGSGGGLPEDWVFSAEAKRASCVPESAGPGAATRVVRLANPAPGAGSRGSVMLAQHGVPMADKQYYRVSLRARSEGLEDGEITLTVMNTDRWHPLFDYQRFAPSGEWKTFTFLVKAQASAAANTRFQIWYDCPGTVWLADVSLTPCAAPTDGRWSGGLYLDRPEEWDDPYRFFRW